ncbi:MAG: hypothetical protein JXA61_09505, partial [Bacteroidales bacterium]|nr:hypothetical protein [Bacteroidales bacterium]
MKTFTFLFEILTIASFLTSCKVATELQPSDEADISEFVGQWIIHVADGGISWMDVRQEEGYLDADLLWKEGSVDPVSDVYLVKNEYLVVTRTYETVLQRDENNNPVRSRMITRWLEIKSDGEDISGYYLQPRRNGTGIDSLAFTGNRMPPVPEAPNLSNLNYGEPVTLFNGTGLSGWIPTDTGLVNGFTVIDGIMVNDVAQKE